MGVLVRASRSQSEITRDYSTTNMFALVASLLLLIAFIFLPWFGDRPVMNGARLFSDNLYRVPGAISAPLIWLLPIASLTGIILALWGILRPEHDRLAAYFGLLAGVIGLVYFVHFAANPTAQPGNMATGSGFWVSLVALIGQVLGLPVTRLWLARGGVGRRRGFGVPPQTIPYLFLVPALALYLVWIIGPTIYTFYLSLTNWDGVSTASWVGLANFQRLFTKDALFIESLINNLRWLLLFITVPTTLGLLMAMVFNTEMKGSRFYKVSFYLPLILSLPVIGLIWAWVYNPRLGLINQALAGLGVPPADLPGWLGDRRLAIWCVIAAAIWRQVGYVMVLYLAGLKNVDPTYLDAARVDGCNRWNLFRHVLFPLLAPVTTIVVVISIIDSLRAFDLVAIMTRGGQSTQVLANFMYIEAFNNYRMGYAAAIAVVLFAISMVFIGFYLSRVVRDELEY
ncbi:MAG: sugar ABC transporter permease [Anaerolineae bacterium]|nr:sugar ABC transporter permease [Anaerolineae bacterium]